MAAGKYSTRFLWGKWDGTYTVSATGQRVPNVSDNGYLWGSIEADTSRRQEEYGSQQTGATATVKLRQYPAISGFDSLTDSLGYKWHVESVIAGDNEMVCDCYYFDTEGDGRT